MPQDPQITNKPQPNREMLSVNFRRRFATSDRLTFFFFALDVTRLSGRAVLSHHSFQALAVLRHQGAIRRFRLHGTHECASLKILKRPQNFHKFRQSETVWRMDCLHTILPAIVSETGKSRTGALSRPWVAVVYLHRVTCLCQ